MSPSVFKCVCLIVLSVCEGIKRACDAAAKLSACLSHNPGLQCRPQMLGASSQQLHGAYVRCSEQICEHRCAQSRHLLSLGVAPLWVKMCSVVSKNVCKCLPTQVSNYLRRLCNYSKLMTSWLMNVGHYGMPAVFSLTAGLKVKV